MDHVPYNLQKVVAFCIPIDLCFEFNLEPENSDQVHKLKDLNLDVLLLFLPTTFPHNPLPTRPISCLEVLVYTILSSVNMVYSLTYRRPPHVDSARSSVMGNEKAKSIGESSIDSQISGGSGGMTFGIPDALSFDRIITGGTCPVS